MQGAILRRLDVTVLGGALIALFATPVAAHHGNQAYDLTQLVTSTAVVASVTWANPHCLLHVTVKEPGGEVRTWSVELYNPLYMKRAGWTSTSLKVGDEITISFHPAKNGAPNGYIRAEDGKIVVAGRELNLAAR